MSRDAAVAAVPRPISQVIEITCAAVGCGGSCGGLGRLPKQQQNQCAAVLRRLRRGAPHTPYALRGAFGARLGRINRRAMARANPKACQLSRPHESLYHTIGWRSYEATSRLISDLPLVRAVAGELAAAAKVRLR
jgi:hypothetical protein